MTRPIEEGTTEVHGETRTVHYLIRLPQPVDKIWTALATPEGLRGWLSAVDVFEPRLGGAVGLRGLGSGRITAWDVERVAEYSVGSRLRFHLEPDGEDAGTLRFTYETEGDRDPDWRACFERLLQGLSG